MRPQQAEEPYLNVGKIQYTTAELHPQDENKRHNYDYGIVGSVSY